MTWLIDSLFSGQNCVHASGENLGRSPKKVIWKRRGLIEEGDHVWFTDSDLEIAKEYNGPKVHKVAWILEPWEYRRTAYEYLIQHPKEFDTILVYDREPGERLLEADENVRLYVFGGSRIAKRNWNVYPKQHLVSIVASEKRSMPGQRLRHDLIANSRVTAFGPEYINIDDKGKALKDFYFHVAIEACRRDFFFTEAIIDPMLMGCVPIYWGCPSIKGFFDERGMIICENYLELHDAVKSVNAKQYESMKPYIKNNFHLAQKYQLTEDWLYEQFPELFDE